MAISAHRRVLLLPLLLAAVSLQQATGQAPGDPCFTNLTEIMLLQATLDPLADKVFTLCPNTIFDIGFPSSGGACCFDGQHPLVARQNTRFQCGETGASSNNCILRGGRSQFLSAPELLNEDNSRVQVAGLSFESAAFFTAVLGNAGSITFSDCVWRVRVKLTLILVLVLCRFVSFAFFSFFFLTKPNLHSSRVATEQQERWTSVCGLLFPRDTTTPAAGAHW